MPKSQFVDPGKDASLLGSLTFTDIPMNQYKKRDCRRTRQLFG